MAPPPFQFKDIHLLSCEFETWPDREDGSPEFDGEYSHDEFLKYQASTERREDQFLMFLAVRLEDPALPFNLFAAFGCEFDVTDMAITPERAEPTLVFMAYPYVREFVFNLTGRSPLPAYALPPLTRQPDPDPQGDTAR